MSAAGPPQGAQAPSGGSDPHAVGERGGITAAGVPLRVTVVYSPAPREVREWALCLQPGATLRDALRASGLPQAFPGIDLATAEVGVWGRQAAMGQPLRDGDRVEVYRPLQVDPKLARRERFRRQGARGAGLFAGRKAGAKAGY